VTHLRRSAYSPHRLNATVRPIGLGINRTLILPINDDVPASAKSRMGLVRAAGPGDARSAAATSADGEDWYRGANRRARWSETRSGLPGKDVLQQAAALVLGAMVPVGFALARGITLAAAADLVHLLSAILAVGAGVAALICWKVLGLARYGWWGSALTVFGLLGLANESLPVLGVGQLSAVEPFGRLIIDLIIMGIIFQALRSPEIDARLVPGRLTVAATAVGLLLLGALSLLSAHGDLPAPLVGATGQAVVEGFMAGAWAALAAIALLRRSSGRQMGWNVPVMLLFATGELATAARSAGGTSWMFAGAVLTLVGLALACSECGGDLSYVLRGQDRQVLRLRLDLDAARREITIERGHLDERLHDLRNAVSAVRSADSTLRHYRGRLDPETRTSLADAISSELSRVQLLIEPGERRHLVDFSLSETVGPVVATERSLGADIRLKLEDIRVHGDPDSLAQVVQNLLVNARRYASGTPVELRAFRHGDRVELRVRDAGSGIAETERVAIFDRGVRGSQSEGTVGSGLGLYVAAQLMADMGGSIRVQDTDRRGACFSVDLLAAPDLSVGSEPASTDSAGTAYHLDGERAVS
jgi:two-component system, OmpR family, sensor kinase